MLLTPPLSLTNKCGDESLDQIMKLFLRDFTMSWLAKGSLSFLPLLAKLLTKRKHPIGSALLDAYFRSDALKFGVFVASYFTTFKLFDRLLQKKAGKYRFLLAGALATIPGYLLVGKEVGAGVGTYLIFRATHSLILHYYQTNNPKGYLEDWLVKHGNEVLFFLSVGQLMYGYVVDPDRLEPSYLNYLTRVSYIHPYVHQATQNIERNLPIDYSKLSQIAGTGIKELKFGKLVPCECFHPGQGHVERMFKIFLWNFRDVLPVYVGLYGVPQMLVNGLNMFNTDNLNHLLLNITRSSTFISVIIALYQSMFCLQRTFLPITHRYTYWVMGVLASVGVLIEKKGRRTELALYVLPKAAQMLLNYVIEPSSEAMQRLNYALFALAMSLIMVVLQHFNLSIFIKMNQQV